MHGIVRIRRLREQVKRLKNRLEGAYVDKLDGVITPERHNELTSRWRCELKGIETSISQHNQAATNDLAVTAKVFELTQGLANTYVSKKPAGRRRILDALSLKLRLHDVSLVPTYNKPFDLIAEGHRNGFDSG